MSGATSGALAERRPDTAPDKGSSSTPDAALHGRVMALREGLERGLIGSAGLVERLLIGLLTGGHLLIDFPATAGPHEETQAYDHTVVTAYRWSPDRFAELLADHGLTESARLVIEPKPTDRRQFQEIQLLACKA